MDGFIFFGIMLVAFHGLVVPILAVYAFAAARRQAIRSLEGELLAGRRPDSPLAARPPRRQSKP